MTETCFVLVRGVGQVGWTFMNLSGTFIPFVLLRCHQIGSHNIKSCVKLYRVIIRSSFSLFLSTGRNNLPYKEIFNGKQSFEITLFRIKHQTREK